MCVCVCVCVSVTMWHVCTVVLFHTETITTERVSLLRQTTSLTTEYFLLKNCTCRITSWTGQRYYQFNIPGHHQINYPGQPHWNVLPVTVSLSSFCFKKYFLFSCNPLVICDDHPWWYSNQLWAISNTNRKRNRKLMNHQISIK